MDVKRELFLPALKAALKNETVSWEKELEPQVWMELFQIAGKHQVLPIAFHSFLCDVPQWILIGLK